MRQKCSSCLHNKSPFKKVYKNKSGWQQRAQLQQIKVFFQTSKEQAFLPAMLGAMGLKWDRSTNFPAWSGWSCFGGPGTLEQHAIRSLCGSKTFQMSRWKRSKCDSAGQALPCKPSCLIDCRATEPSCLSGRQEAVPGLMENTETEECVCRKGVADGW